MAVNSGRPWHEAPNLFRTVTAGSLLTVSGAPQRNAAALFITNGNAAAVETAVFQGPDAVNVTITVGAASTVELDGEFTVLGTLGANTTVVAAWFDDGTVRKNP